MTVLYKVEAIIKPKKQYPHEYTMELAMLEIEV